MHLNCSEDKLENTITITIAEEGKKPGKKQINNEMEMTRALVEDQFQALSFWSNVFFISEQMVSLLKKRVVKMYGKSILTLKFFLIFETH